MPKRSFVTVDNLISKYITEDYDIVDVMLKEAEDSLNLTPQQLGPFRAIGFLDPRNVRKVPLIVAPFLIFAGLLQLPLIPIVLADDKLKQILRHNIQATQPLINLSVNALRDAYTNVRIPSIVLKLLNGFAKVLSKIKNMSEKVFHFIATILVAGCLFISNALLRIIGLTYDSTVVTLGKQYVKQHASYVASRLKTLANRILTQIKRAVTLGTQLAIKAVNIIKQKLGMKSESIEMLQEGIFDRIGSLIFKPILNFAKDFFGLLAGLFADALDVVGLSNLLNKFPFSMLKKLTGYGHQLMQKIEATTTE